MFHADTLFFSYHALGAGQGGSGSARIPVLQGEQHRKHDLSLLVFEVMVLTARNGCDKDFWLAKAVSVYWLIGKISTADLELAGAVNT